MRGTTVASNIQNKIHKNTDSDVISNLEELKQGKC